MLNEKVIWIKSGKIVEGVVSKVTKDSVWVDGQHKPEDCIYKVYIYPDSSAYREMLQRAIDEMIRHKQENEKLLVEQLKANNELIQKGWK